MADFLPYVTLIHEIDFTKDYGSDYFESHPTAIRHTEAGAYRECAAIRFSRFAYKFDIEKVQKPHVLSIMFPDDKERTFCIMDGRTYDLSSGIATGREIPISGKMIEHNIIFWPRWHNCTVMFATWDEKAPAAVAGIRIYELDEQYFEVNSAKKGNEGFRSIGFQWEDPSGRFCTMGANNGIDWTKRIADYSVAAGQNVVVYPLTWYWGCLYPSNVDATDHNEILVDSQSNLYINGMSKVYDWVAETIDILGKRNINFMGSFQAYRFHKLLKQANNDLDSILAGKQTINNITYDGRVQKSTNDWTRTWTRLNLPFIADTAGANSSEVLKGTAYECIGEGMKIIPEHILGEPMGKAQGFCAPIFNCLSPEVEKHLLSLMEELREKYGRFENFKGITIPLWGATFIWYASLKVGYDDYTFSLFENETGIVSEINVDDPARFQKRFTWLMKHHKSDWIKWRCVKIKNLLLKMRKALAAKRNDVRLVISICREPLLGQLFCDSSYVDTYHADSIQLCNLGDLYSILREGGIDLDMYDGSDGIEMEIQNDPYRDRSLEIRSGRKPNSNSLRDHDFLDKKTNDSIARGNNRNVFIFNCYYETGGYVISKANHEAHRILSNIGSGLGELYRIHLSFDHPIWPWFPHEYTTCPGVPASGRNFLEYYAQAVARIDAKKITFGGLLIGSYGHEKELKQFSDVFTALPADRFSTLPSNTDMVVLRYLENKQGNYLYLINTEPTEISVFVEYDRKNLRVFEIGSPTSTEVRIEGGWHGLVLKPYELKAFRYLDNSKPVCLHVTLSDEFLERIQKAKDMLDQVRMAEVKEKWQQWLVQELCECITNGHHARLRHLFRSYPLQKIKEISDSLPRMGIGVA